MDCEMILQSDRHSVRGLQVVLLLHTLTEPFVENENAERAGYSSRPPAWASELSVSCSS